MINSKIEYIPLLKDSHCISGIRLVDFTKLIVDLSIEKWLTICIQIKNTF